MNTSFGQSCGRPLSVWSLIASLYTTQFLALSFFSVALVAILREQGAALEQISSVYGLGMIAALRFLWSPLVDRLRPLAKAGHFRGWLLLMQSLMILILVCISFQNVATDFPTVYMLCIALALCGATQDIATDGLVCSLLTERERGIGNGIQTAGGMFGFILGAGLVLMVFPAAGWQASVLLLAAGTAISLVQLFFFKEPEAPEHAAGQVPRRGLQAVTRLASFWKQKGMVKWLCVLVLFPMGITMAYSLLMPVLVDNNWSLERIGFFVNILGPVAGMAASLLAGWLISRLGRSRMLVWCIVMQAVSVLGVLLVASGFTSTAMVTLAVLAHFLGYVPSVTLLCTLMMDNASQTSPATDYTVQYSVYQFIAMGIGGASMALAGSLGYAGTMYLALALIIPGAAAAICYLRRAS